MQKILIGTNNKGKIREYEILFKGIFRPIPLNYLGLHLDVNEDGSSYEENALIKLKYLKDKSPFPVITDDSGLEVTSLNNEPGIFSARYSGKNSSDERNIQIQFFLNKEFFIGISVNCIIETCDETENVMIEMIKSMRMSN